MKKTIVILLIIVFCTMGASLEAIELFPTRIKKIFHLMFQPDDLYDSVVTVPFNFWEKGYTGIYDLNFKYDDTYAISIDCGNTQNGIPSGWGTDNKFHFNGKLVADFFYNEDLIISKEIGSEEAVFYQNGSMDYLKKIILLSIDIPLNGKYKKGLRLRLSVIKPDIYLERFKTNIKLSIAVSGVK